MDEIDPAGELMTGAPQSATDDFFAQNPPNQPTSRGRMYITPTPVPTLSPDDQAALQARLAAGTAGRAPITPPTGQGAITVPDMGAGIKAAFGHLPVDQAVKAIEAAMQYQGQRGYQQDTANGMTSAQALTKWGPLLFSRSPTGMATALRLSNPNQIAPGEAMRIALAQRQQNFREQQAKNALSPLQHQDLLTKAATLREMQQALSKAISDGDPAVVQQMRQAVDTAQKDYENFRASIGGAPVPAPATAGPAPLAPPPAAPVAPPPPGLLTRARNAIFGAPAGAQPTRAPVSAAAPANRVTTKEQYDALPPGTVYIGKNGKKYRKPAESTETTDE